MLAGHTGQDLEKIKTDTDRDFWMGSDEATVYGIVDQVIQARSLESVKAG